MSIKFKFLISFLSISLLTLIFSFLASNYIQLKSNKIFQQVAGKSLPGSVALARMSTEFYRIEFLLDIYQDNPSEKIRINIEKALAALAEHQTTQALFNQDINTLHSITGIVERYNRLVAEYLLAFEKSDNELLLKELENKLQNSVEEFTFVVTPHIDSNIKKSYLEAASLQEVYKNSNFILWGFSLGIIFILILISIYFSRLITKPIDVFIKLIDQYGQGKNISFDTLGKLPKEIQDLKNVLESAIKKRFEAEQLLSHQANHDALTGLPNRYLSVDRLNQLILEAKRNHHLVAVMFIDLDDFKKFNDTLGHGIGDTLLRSIADQLKQCVRAEDTIGRLGGDEFIGIFGNLNSVIDAHPLAENIKSQFNKPFDVEGRDFNLSASIGISFYPDDGDDSSELLKKADTAMYHSKVSGKNIYTFHSEEMYKTVKRRLEIEENLVLALERNEFQVVFQPKYKTNPIEIVGFEALLRWNNPELGQVAPDEFIPVAEHSGLIISIGKCIVRQAIDFITQINRTFGKNYSIAVNLSPAQFRESNLVNYIEEQLDYFKFDANLFEVEITENLLLQENELIFRTLEQLNDNNIKIAMDDFGTGYSSLNYLRRFPFDEIKIDRNFIQDVETSKSDKELVIATILMAHALELKVIAEGVETEGQLQFLIDHECDVVQGYYLSRPLSFDDLLDYLKATLPTDQD